MKRKFILVAFAALVIGAGLSSCKKKEGCTDEKATNYDSDAEKDDNSCKYDNSDFQEIGGVKYYIVPGSITTNLTLTSDKKWLLTGGVKVMSGGIINIQAGTQIFAADNSATPFLSIQRGGKIMAKGTAQSPIVLTTIKKVTGTPVSGSWGGIIVNGYAKINNGQEAEGEGGTGLYGGNNDADDSGVIQYVRVEYAGKILGTDNELNGFSFNAVGNKTIVDHIQAYKGSDDGIEFFGGTVNVKYAVSTGNEDDSFDWTHGWRGMGQFWVAEQSAHAGDRGIEADNLKADNLATPVSSPTLSNITLVGADDGGAENIGVTLRLGTKGGIHNAIIAGFPAIGVGVVDEVTISNMNDRSLGMSNSVVFGSAVNWKDCPVFENDPTNSIDPINLVGVVGTTTSNLDPKTINPWFESAKYKGAIPSSNNWLQGWTLGL